MSLCGVKERASHQRHQIGYARDRQGCPEAGHYYDDCAREAKDRQCFIYGATLVTTARSDDVTTRRVLLGRDLASPTKSVVLPNGTNKWSRNRVCKRTSGPDFPSTPISRSTNPSRNARTSLSGLGAK